MRKKTKLISLAIIMISILIIGAIVLNLYNKGFKFYTYKKNSDKYSICDDNIILSKSLVISLTVVSS